MKVLLFASKKDHHKLISELLVKGFSVCERTTRFFKADPRGELELDTSMVISDQDEIIAAYEKYGVVARGFDEIAAGDSDEIDPMTLTKAKLAEYLKEKGLTGLSGLNLAELQALIPTEE